MNKIIALIMLALVSVSAHASYLFDGTNDRLVGTFTSTYGDPLTICVFLKVTAHPTAVDFIASIGNTAGDNSDSYGLRTNTIDNQWQAVSQTATDTTGNATLTLDIDAATIGTTYNATTGWTGYCGKFSGDAARDVYIGTITNTATSALSRAVADAVNDLQFGESLESGGDFTGLLAEIAIWDVALSDANITNYLEGDVASGIDASNLIGYWPLDTNGVLTNQGLDAGGDLTATNSVFNADHPTITSGEVAPTFDSNPVCAELDSNTIRCTLDADANATLVKVCIKAKDAAAPADGAAVNTCASGTGSLSTAATGASQNVDIDVTSPASDPLPFNDVYVSLLNTTLYSSVQSQLDEAFTAPAGYQYVQKSGAPTPPEIGLFDDASPAIADNDTMQAQTHCDSFDLGAAISQLTLFANTTFEIDTPGDDSRQNCPRRFADYSVPGWSDSAPVAYYINDTPQIWIGVPQQEGEPDPWLIAVDEPHIRILDDMWSDEEDDPLVHDITNVPSGLAVMSNETLEGTPDTCGVFTTMVYESTSITGTVETESDQDLTVGARIPDVLGDDQATADAAIEALCSLTATLGGVVFSETVPIGTVVNTDPAIGTVVVPDQEVLYFLSLGPSVGGNLRIMRARNGMRLIFE